MTLGNNYGHAELAATGGANLTAKQERFTQLIALDGLEQSDAYRQIYAAARTHRRQRFGPKLPG